MVRFKSIATWSLLAFIPEFVYSRALPASLRPCEYRTCRDVRTSVPSLRNVSPDLIPRIHEDEDGSFNSFSNYWIGREGYHATRYEARALVPFRVEPKPIVPTKPKTPPNGSPLGPDGRPKDATKKPSFGLEPIEKPNSAVPSPKANPNTEPPKPKSDDKSDTKPIDGSIQVPNGVNTAPSATPSSRPLGGDCEL